MKILMCLFVISLFSCSSLSVSSENISDARVHNLDGYRGGNIVSKDAGYELKQDIKDQEINLLKKIINDQENLIKTQQQRILELERHIHERTVKP